MAQQEQINKNIHTALEPYFYDDIIGIISQYSQPTYDERRAERKKNRERIKELEIDNRKYMGCPDCCAKIGRSYYPGNPMMFGNAFETICKEYIEPMPWFKKIRKYVVSP